MDINEKITVLSHLDIFAGVSKEDIGELAAASALCVLDEGKVLYRQGEEAESCYLILSGEVTLSVVSPSGRLLIVSTLHKGAFIGEAAVVGDTYHSTEAEVTEGGTLAVIPGDRLRQLLQRKPTLGLGLMRAMVRRVHEVEQRVYLMSNRSVSSRVAMVLVRLSRERGAKLSDMSHETLAQFAGTYRETASKAIHLFISAGYVRQVKQQHLAILDTQALSAFANEYGRKPVL